jgi:hypothetical protein
MTGTTRPARSAFTISPFLVGSSGSRRPCQSRLVAQDLGLEPPELRAGIDAEFVDEAGARILVDLQGLRLPARTIQRQHELLSERLAQWVIPDQRLQLADHVGVAAELEVRLDPFLARNQPKLLEAPGLCLSEVVEGEFREGGAAPECEGIIQTLAPFGRRQLAHPRERPLEPASVDLILSDMEHVARCPGLEDVGSERTPQAPDRVLQRGGRRLRRFLAPEEVDQPIRRNDPSGLEYEDRQKPALLRTTERDRPGLVRDLEWAEYPEFERHRRH